MRTIRKLSTNHSFCSVCDFLISFDFRFVCLQTSSKRKSFRQFNFVIAILRYNYFDITDEIYESLVSQVNWNVQILHGYFFYFVFLLSEYFELSVK